MAGPALVFIVIQSHVGNPIVDATMKGKRGSGGQEYAGPLGKKKIFLFFGFWTAP